MLTIETDSGWIRVESIVLLPSAQGQGVGTHLMLSVLDEAARCGKHVRLTVLKVSRAVLFYRGLGFRTVGQTNTHLELECGPCHTN
jgi:ribosomal protein S18 acetylase RimI-like enzyme